MVSQYFQCFSLKFSVCLRPVLIGFHVFFSLCARNLSRKRTWENYAKNCRSDDLRSHRRSVGSHRRTKKKAAKGSWGYRGSRRTVIAITDRLAFPSMLTESSQYPSSKDSKNERTKDIDGSSCIQRMSSMSVDGNRKLVKKLVEKEVMYGTTEGFDGLS